MVGLGSHFAKGASSQAIALRGQVNDYIRTLPTSRPDICGGVLDVGQAIETSPNSGISKSGWKADTFHFSQTGAAGVAGIIFTSTLFNR